MEILITEGWDEYELLDTGNRQRLERFGNYTLVRPDPQACWKPSLPHPAWEKADATFIKTKSDSGIWKRRTPVPENWLIRYKDLSFRAELTPFKHTGIFPEQHVQWDWMRRKIKDANRQTNILNLFGYTGIATLAAAAEGAKVTHVDASKPGVTWAHENQKVSGLADTPIRWIVDDAVKFTAREIRRGAKYDGIVMDPPVYGHGPHGEKWDFMKDIPILLNNCRSILSDTPLFILLNAYAISASALMLGNVLNDYVDGLKGNTQVGELVLQEKSAHRLLSTGIYGRWSRS